jgi:hypothetical protein
MDWSDINYPRVVLIVLLIGLNIGLIGAVTTSSTPYGPFNGEWDGTSELRQTISGDATVNLAHQTEAYETDSPDETVAFIIAPQQEYTPSETARIRQFVSQGGTLVVTADSNQTNQLLAGLSVTSRLDGRLIRDERENYQNASLPVATNVSPHPLTEGVESVTLNYGTVINTSAAASTKQSAEEQPTYLINTSSFSYLDGNRNNTLDDSEQLASRPVAVSESVGNGRVVLVSDGSLFTNAMLDQSDNRQFAQQLATNQSRVILDYSHGHPLPPLVYGLLVVQGTPLLQFALGLVVLSGILIWYRRPSIPILDREEGDETSTPSSTQLDGEELTEFLETKYPEWNDAHIERVTKAIIRSRRQTDSND